MSESPFGFSDRCFRGGILLLEPRRPGLPPSGYGRAEPRRQQRVQLGFHVWGHQWYALEFQHDVALSQRFVLPRFRFSVALPLGRNGTPAPGFRDAGNHGRLGAPVGSGNYGYNWSSSFSGTSGVFLNFGTQHLYTSFSDYRGHGHQLRCLSE